MDAKLEQLIKTLGLENGLLKLLTVLDTLKQSPGDDMYEFEHKLIDGFKEFELTAAQASIGKLPKSKNKKIIILSSFGYVTVPKKHALSSLSAEFKITPFLQERMCRMGALLPFDHAAEELRRYLNSAINAKQIERVCHHYGGLLEKIGPEVLKTLMSKPQYKNNEIVYVMIDGSMILTRKKGETWKEVKLARIIEAKDMAEEVSKDRNQILNSEYVGHLGNSDDFFDKLLEQMPSGDCTLVFICDGAKWIWNWVTAYYPDSIQILDLYHFKEHLYAFSNILYGEGLDAKNWVDRHVDMLMKKDVSGMMESLKNTQSDKKSINEAKEKLYKYLQNNIDRINYGSYEEQGLTLGSGAIESANREVIQKRMKLSGQRWTLDGAQQMLDLRVCLKSNRSELLKHIITSKHQKVA